MLGIFPLEHKQSIAEPANLPAKAQQATIVCRGTVVVDGDRRITPSCNTKPERALHSALAALPIDLNVNVVAMLGRPPAVLTRLEGTPQLPPPKACLQAGEHQRRIGKKMIVHLQGLVTAQASYAREVVAGGALDPCHRL